MKIPVEYDIGVTLCVYELYVYNYTAYVRGPDYVPAMFSQWTYLIYHTHY